MRRVFHAPAVVRGLVTDTHFNNAVGAVVRNKAEFVSELHRRSDQMSERMGFEVDYQPVPAGEAPGVDLDGARESQRKKELKQGAEPKFIAS